MDLTELNPDPIPRGLLYDRIKSWLLRSGPDVRDVNALHGALTTVIVKHENLDGVKERLMEANYGNRRSDKKKQQQQQKGSGKGEMSVMTEEEEEQEAD